MRWLRPWKEVDRQTSPNIRKADIDGVNSKKYQDFIDAHRDSAISDETQDDRN
jgi:hypothetical protein